MNKKIFSLIFSRLFFCCWFGFLGLFFPAAFTFAQVDLNQVSANQLAIIKLDLHAAESVNGLGSKIIQLEQSSEANDSFQLSWYSSIRKETGKAPWPEYKIQVLSGQLAGIFFQDKRSLFLHPHLWPKSQLTLDSQSFALFAPEFFVKGSLKKRKPAIFTLGFSNPQKIKLAFASILQKRLTQFREELIKASKLDSDESMEERVKRRYRDFLEEWQSLYRLARKSQDYRLKVNGKAKLVKVRLLGNDFLELKVLKNQKAPLVLAMRFKAAKAPKKLKPSLYFFNKYLSFRVSEVCTQKFRELCSPF